MYIMVFIFPLQVKNKLHDGIYKCAFIHKLGIAMNKYCCMTKVMTQQKIHVQQGIT
jgi:hypothetical protein